MPDYSDMVAVPATPVDGGKPVPVIVSLDDVAVAPRVAAQPVRRERIPPVSAAAAKAKPAKRKEGHPYFGGHKRR